MSGGGDVTGTWWHHLQSVPAAWPGAEHPQGDMPSTGGSMGAGGDTREGKGKGNDPPHALSCCPAEREGRRAARLEAEALQEACLLQLLPHHAAGRPQAGPLLLL